MDFVISVLFTLLWTFGTVLGILIIYYSLRFLICVPNRLNDIANRLEDIAEFLQKNLDK